MKNEFKTIVTLNLIALIAYIFLFLVVLKDNSLVLYFATFLLHTFALWVESVHVYLQKEKRKGSAYLLSSVLIFVIGGIACFIPKLMS